MDRPMRRKRQALSLAETEALLRDGSHAVMALVDTDGEPYAVPVSYAYVDGTVWVHGAVEGHKLACVAHEPRVSLCVVDADDVVPEKMTTVYRSAVCFGRATVRRDEEGVRRGLAALADKYCPDVPGIAEEVEGALGRCAVIEVRVDRVTGKEAIELVRARNPRPRP